MGHVQSERTPKGVHVSFASDPLPFIAPWTSEKLNSFLIFIFISLYRLLKNHQGDHIYEQIDNLYTVFIQTVERRHVQSDWREHCFLTSSVTLRDTMLFMDI